MKFIQIFMKVFRRGVTFGSTSLADWSSCRFSGGVSLSASTSVADWCVCSCVGNWNLLVL